MLIPSVDFRMIKSYQPVNKDDNLCESSDDEIIFVKEYKITALKVFKKLNAKKIIAKEAPRRNPIRKVRMKKHFKEYIDVSVFEEIEEYDNSIQQENYVENFENAMKGNREFEKWKKKSGFKKGKAKYENISKSNKQGIKRKANKSKLNEKKVKIKDLESLFYSNLALIENYINDVKILNKYTFKAANDLNKSARFKWAKTILKQQLKLLAVVMVNSDDLLKHKIS